MKSDSKQRINIWLHPGLLARMDSQLADTDSRNRSEYIGKAIDFYAGFIASEGIEDYISKGSHFLSKSGRACKNT